MKTVCFIVQNQYNGDIRVRRKAEALVAAGYEVDVIALRSPKSDLKTYQLAGVNVHTVPLSKNRGSLFRYFSEYTSFFFHAFWILSKLMGSRRYQIVDVNNLPDFLVFAALWAKLRGAKVVFDMHEITPEFYISKYNTTSSAFAVRLNKFLERISMAFADHVITINEPISRLLSTRGLKLEHSTIIMNCVDMEFFAMSDRRPRPASVPTQRPRFVMMYHGTLTHIYGLDLAIEAFRQAKAQMPGAEYWILGSGPEKNALIEQAKKAGLENEVKVIGSVPAEDISHWLDCCDMGVLSTRRDVFLDLSFSNKLSEYIVKGKPVICSRLKAIGHYFSNDALAYFEPNSAEDLARQMVRVYQDAALRERLAKQANAEFYPIRWEVMKERYLNLIDRMTGSEERALDTKAEPA